MRPARAFSSDRVGEAPGGADAHAVAREPGDDVEVNVEDVLAGRLAVGQEEVDPLAADPRCADRGGHALGHAHQVGGILGVQAGQGGGVGTGDHQQVARDGRANVHKGQGPLILVDQAGRLPAGDDAAKDAVGVRLIRHGFSLRCLGGG